MTPAGKDAEARAPNHAEARAPIWLWIGSGVFVVAIGLMIATSVSVRRAETPVFAVSRLEAHEVPTGLIGPDTVTLDARSNEHWVHFNLGRGTIVQPGQAWDLAVKRHRLVVNGGNGFAGSGGVMLLEVPFASVARAPSSGYEPSRVTGGGDTVNAVFDDWYAYSLFSHLLKPEPITFVVRTHDGNYAKLAILSYYCPGPEAGCVTLQYVYQGDGSPRLGP